MEFQLTNDGTKGTSTGKERRKHTRFPINQPARLTVLRGGNFENLGVTLVNLSRSGIAIILPVPLPPGATVEIHWEQTAVFAEVRHCSLTRPGAYRAGVAIQQVVSTQDASAHLSLDTLDRYATGQLSEAETRFVARHL